MAELNKSPVPGTGTPVGGYPELQQQEHTSSNINNMSSFLDCLPTHKVEHTLPALDALGPLLLQAPAWPPLLCRLHSRGTNKAGAGLESLKHQYQIRSGPRDRLSFQLPAGHALFNFCTPSSCCSEGSGARVGASGSGSCHELDQGRTHSLPQNGVSNHTQACPTFQGLTKANT